MKTYKCGVRVPGLTSGVMMTVWASVCADDPFSAKRMLEAQYGRGNVVGTPTVVR